MLVGAAVALLAALAIWTAEGRDGPAEPRTAAQSPGTSPLGTWRADGIVEASAGAVDQPEGTRLQRQWIFFEKCGAAGCELWLSRQTAGAYETAPVERRGDQLHTVFERRTDGCGTREKGVLAQTTVIELAPGGRELRASQHVRGEYPGCTFDDTRTGRVATELTWTAQKLSGECAVIPDCRQEP